MKNTTEDKFCQLFEEHYKRINCTYAKLAEACGLTPNVISYMHYGGKEGMKRRTRKYVIRLINGFVELRALETLDEANALLKAARPEHGNLSPNATTAEKNLYEKLSDAPESTGLMPVSKKTFSLKGDTYDQQDKQKKRKIIEKVENFWIKGVLWSAMHLMARIQLEKEQRLDMIYNPWDRVLEIPAQEPVNLNAKSSALEILNEFGGTLLILGAPGAGKTVSLLELARDQIKCIEQDDDVLQPIPVILNLSSWIKHKGSLANWIIDELVEKYVLPRKDSKIWLEKNDLLILLDGLDEVESDFRELCVQKINEFTQEYSLANIVVCSREQEYSDLETKLKFNAAIKILDLKDNQVFSFLKERRHEADIVRQVLDKDSNIREVARTPLMLNIMVLAYDELSSEKFRNYKTLEDYRSCLFDVYIEKMLQRRKKISRFSDKDTISWLNNISVWMKVNGQSILYVEHISDWNLSLFYKSLIQLFEFVISILLIGIPFALATESIFRNLTTQPFLSAFIGVFGGLTATAIVLLGERQSFGKLGVGIIGILGCVSLGLVTIAVTNSWQIAVLVGMVSGFMGSFTFGWIGRSPKETDHGKSITKPRVFENMEWSWKHALRGSVSTIPAAVLIGMIVTFLANFVIKEISVSVTAGISVACIGVSALGLARGLIPYESSQKTTKPNQGIYNSFKNGLMIGSFAGLIFAVFSFIPLAMYLNVRNGLFSSLSFGVSGLGAGGLYMGGLVFIRHYMTRVILWYLDEIPWMFEGFLNYATDKIFFFRVGGGYIFIHKLLLEHFSKLSKN